MNTQIIIIAIIVMAIYVSCKRENFDDQKVSFGRLTTGTKLTDDSLFSNVVTYNNDDYLYKGINNQGKLGIDKCIHNCHGQCIEFGITGIGMCFPNN